MSFIISLLVSFFLSLKWITNKKLLIEKKVSWDEIVMFRYCIALIFSLILIFFFPWDYQYNQTIIFLMMLIAFVDFLWSYMTQKYTKIHPNSSFQNFLWSFVPIAYIPIWVIFLGESFWLYDFLWVLLIIFSLHFFLKIKEINFASALLFWIVIFRLLSIYLIWLYIALWGYFLYLLIFIYLFVIFSYIWKYFVKKYHFQKITPFHVYDALFFSIWSIGSFFLYQLFQSYEVKLFLLSTFLFNVVLFKIFYDEDYFLKKIIMSFGIILWLILLRI